MNKTYFIDTYGCQMNVADSELVESLLRREGYAKAPQIDQADAIFVNTCAIREHAEEKVHSQLGRYDQSLAFWDVWPKVLNMIYWRIDLMLI